MKQVPFWASLTVLIALSPFGFSHPPDSLQIAFDSTGTVMSVTVFHPVKNPANHYIDDVIVKIDGKQVIVQSFPIQITNKLQEAIYKVIGLKTGAVVEMTAVCSITGRKTVKYTVP